MFSNCCRNTQGLTLIAVIFTVHCLMDFTSSKGYKLEYGHALRQELLIKLTDSEINDLIKFVEQYARKRFPWSVPRFHDQDQLSPEIVAVKKLKLLYSYDDSNPFYYDDTGWDRAGHQYGITRMITLGTMYTFTLCWNESQLLFTHNFTVVLHPTLDSVNLYTHTFHVQYVNQSTSNTKTVLFPKFHYKHLLEKSKNLRPSDLYFTTTEVSVKSLGLGNNAGNVDDIADIAEPNDCDGESCNSYNEFQGEFRYSKFLSKQFSVMSYNIWNMNAFTNKKDGYEKRIAKLTKTILKADPDIIGLQEVRYEEGKGGRLGANQIHTLAEALPEYQYVFQPAQVQDQTLTDGKSVEGVAIMSKYPIISHHYKLLFINRSDSSDMHQRVLLHAQIYLPAIGKVHLLTTHFSLSHMAREQCVLQIVEYAQQLEGPVILTGDFNAEPHEPSIQYLRGKGFLSGQKGVFKDVWETYSPAGNQGYTFSVLEKKPSKRIDYIFHREDGLCCDVKLFEIIDDGSRGSKAASDHLPLMATLSIKDHIKTS